MQNPPEAVGHRRYGIYFLLFLMCTIGYSDRAILSVALPSLNAEFGLSPRVDGLLLSGYLWTYVVFMVPTAFAVDAWGTRRMAALSVTLWSLVTMATCFVWNFSSLFATRLLVGLGEAPCFPLGHRVIREWAPAPERGMASTVFTSGILAGVSFGALASGWLIASLGWRACFLIFGVVGLVWAAVWWMVFRDPSQTSWLGASERRQILDSRELGGQDGAKVSVRTLLSQMPMWGLIITQVCGNYTNVFFLTWLPTYLSTARHISILSSGLQTALCYGIACIGTVLIGFLSDKVLLRFNRPLGGRRYIVAILLLGATVMAYAPFTESHTVLLVLLTVSLICMQSSLANNQALTSDLLQDGQAIGTAIGLLFVFANILAIVAPILTGEIVTRTGSFSDAFLVAAALTVVGAIAALVMPRRRIVSHGLARPAHG